MGKPLVLWIKWVLGAFCWFRSWEVLPPESQEEFFNVSDYFVFFLRLLGKQSHCTKQKTQEDEALLICVLYHQGVTNQKADFHIFSFCLCYTKIKKNPFPNVSNLGEDIFIHNVQECQLEHTFFLWKKSKGVREIGRLGLTQGKTPGGGKGPHSSVLAWKVPRTEEPGVLQPLGSQRLGHD